MPHFESPDEMMDVTSQLHSDRDVFMWITVGAESVLVLLNILPIIVVTCIKHPSERLSIDKLIVALSVTDILSVIIPTPIALTSYLKQHWFGGNLTCDVYQLSSVCFQMTSMCLITLMCADRCWSLRSTLLNNYSTMSNSQSSGAVSLPPRARISSSTLIHVLTIYVICFLFACLPLLGLAPSAFSVTRNTCQSWISARSSHFHTHVFSVCFLSIGFTNLFLTLIVNVLLLKLLWKLSGVLPWGLVPGKNGSNIYPVVLGSDIAQKSLKEISTMTIFVTFVFYVAWMPALILILLEKIAVYSNQSALFYVLLCTTLTGLLNPLIYAMFSKTYFSGYKQVATRLCQLITGCPIKPKGFTAMSNNSGLFGRTTSSLSGIISFSRSNSHTSAMSAHHHHHQSNQDNSSTDSSSQLSLCYSGPGNCDVTTCQSHTQLDALSCTQQKATSIYCTPNGCSSVVDLELNEKVYGDVSMDQINVTKIVDDASKCEADQTSQFDDAKLMILTD